MRRNREGKAQTLIVTFFSTNRVYTTTLELKMHAGPGGAKYEVFCECDFSKRSQQEHGYAFVTHTNNMFVRKGW